VAVASMGGKEVNNKDSQCLQGLIEFFYYIKFWEPFSGMSVVAGVCSLCEVISHAERRRVTSIFLLSGLQPKS
jgi:hypothetical protein